MKGKKMNRNKNRFTLWVSPNIQKPSKDSSTQSASWSKTTCAVSDLKYFYIPIPKKMKKKVVVHALLFLFYQFHAQTDSTGLSPDSAVSGFAVPLFNTLENDGEHEAEQQDVSPLLSSSNDVFTQFCAFQFGSGRFRMRGLSSREQIIYMNGAMLNDPETGTASWSAWGGLNDVTRNNESKTGLAAGRYGPLQLNGYINMDVRASTQRKGTKLGLGLANRIFRTRLMLSHSTGLMKNNWAFTIAASERYGDEVYTPGTYFNAGSFFISTEKKINEKHLLGLTAFMAPNEQGRTSAVTREVYELAGTSNYNPNWGYQQNKVRNASVTKTQRPTIILHDRFGFSPGSELNTTLLCHLGRSAKSGLTWNNADNPSPVYYRYLPDYLEKAARLQLLNRCARAGLKIDRFHK
jgi:hypothetical protein